MEEDAENFQPSPGFEPVTRATTLMVNLSRNDSKTSNCSSRVNGKASPSPEKADGWTNDRQYYSSCTILEIIYALRKRLNWPCEGILEGECPKLDDDEDGKVDKKPILEDDGDFVYCLPRNFGNAAVRYEPYDLCFLDSKKARTLDVYFTVSASFVSKVRYYSLSSV